MASYTTLSEATVTESEGRAVILVYHRIDRPTNDRWQICVSPENFAGHLRHITRTCEPLRLSELVRLAASNDIPDRAVAVTFDDGYRDNLLTALPLLQEHAVPATFFISGPAAGLDGIFWWELLNRSISALGLSSAEAAALHRRLMHLPARERDSILASFPAGVGGLPPRLSPEELRDLASEPLAEIGAHGTSHRALTSLDSEELETEIGANVLELRKATGRKIDAFAFPFGMPCSPHGFQTLRAHGVTTAYSVTPAVVTSRSDPFNLPRVEVRAFDTDSFAASLAELLLAEVKPSEFGY